MFNLFDHRDVIETKFGKDAHEFTERELFNYIWEMHRVVMGYKYPANYHKDISIIKCSMKHYGEDLPKMVKYIFCENNGKWNGQPFSITWWTQNCRWISDKIYGEMKEYEMRRVRASQTPKGFKSLAVLKAG